MQSMSPVRAADIRRVSGCRDCIIYEYEVGNVQQGIDHPFRKDMIGIRTDSNIGYDVNWMNFKPSYCCNNEIPVTTGEGTGQNIQSTSCPCCEGGLVERMVMMVEGKDIAGLSY